MLPKDILWIGAKAGLIDEKHRRRMGEAIWLFLWLLTRQTDLNADGEGIVLYGKLVSLRSINEDTDFPIGTLHRWQKLLEQQDYIRADAQSDGTVFWIMNGKNKKKTRQGVPYLERKSLPTVPDMERSRSTDGTQNARNSQKTQSFREFPTKESTKSLLNYNKDAAVAVQILSCQKQMPGEKSSAELDRRRRLLLKQAEEIKARA